MDLDRKIRILFVHHGTGIGGAPVSLLNLIKSLNPSRFECKVALMKSSQIKELYRNEGIKVEVVDSNNNWFAHNGSSRIQWYYCFRYLKVYLNWRETAFKSAPTFLRSQDVDIVHLNSHVLSSWAYAARKNGLKVVLHNREAIAKGYFGFRYRILRKLISRNCDAIINISKDNYDRLGINSRSYVVYNFVTIPSGYRFPFTTSRIKVLYLGGSAKIKGFQTVVASLPYLREDIVVQFAGNYNSWKKPKTIKDRLINLVKLTFYRSTYLPLIRLLNARNAQILGLLQNPYPYIDDCDILITPFTTEHFSRPAMEAFAYGKPVIGSNVEGMDEIVDHGINGLLVEKGDPKALADAINFLCDNPEKARGMGLKGREKAELTFSPHINANKVESIYREILK